LPDRPHQGPAAYRLAGGGSGRHADQSLPEQHPAGGAGPDPHSHRCHRRHRHLYAAVIAHRPSGGDRCARHGHGDAPRTGACPPPEERQAELARVALVQQGHTQQRTSGLNPMQDVSRGPAPTEHDASPFSRYPAQRLRFAELAVPRPPVSGINVQCQLKHFAIITYAIDPARLTGMIPPRFRLDTILIGGREQALVSAVPFLNVNFRLAAHSSPRLEMAQVDYRAYVIDQHSGERAVWFLGTTLDSWTLPVPRYVWQQPWHPARTRFDCELEPGGQFYRHYRMHSASAWGSAELSLRQPVQQAPTYPGFADEETALFCLTHPLVGFYHRLRDRRLGAYRVWHDRLAVQPAELLSARFALFDRLGLVNY